MSPARFRSLALAAGPLAATAAYGLTAGGSLGHAGAVTLAMAAWMALWWVTEATSLYVTALLPLLVLPLAGVDAIKEVAPAYGHPIIFLALGGFALAVALETWGLHRRFARQVLRATGRRPDRIVAGFMFVGAVLSMWISNTAATLILLPVAQGVLAAVPAGTPHRAAFATALLLSICYACSVGGMTTLVGTTTNSFFAGFLSEQVGVDVTFAGWTLATLPLAAAFLPVAWWVLTRVAFDLPHDEIAEAPRDPGAVASSDAWSPGARATLVAFGVIAGLWMFSGWLAEVPGLGGLDTYTVGVLALVVLFALPLAAGRPILDWREAAPKLPWGVLLLIGGGLALARAISAHGVAEYLAGGLGGLGDLDPLVVTAVCVALMVFVTEVSTNVASVTALAPVVLALAMAAGIDPVSVLFPVTVAASFAFMLPVATPPNAVVFASGEVAGRDMARVGLLLNVVAIGCVVAWSWLGFAEWLS